MKWEDIYSGKAIKMVESEERAARSLERKFSAYHREGVSAFKPHRRSNEHRHKSVGRSRSASNYNVRSRTAVGRNGHVRPAAASRRNRASAGTATATMDVFPIKRYSIMLAVLAVIFALMVSTMSGALARASEPGVGALAAVDPAYVSQDETDVADELTVGIPADEEEFVSDDDNWNDDANFTEAEEQEKYDVPTYEEVPKGKSGNDWQDVTSEDFANLTIQEKVDLVGIMAHDDAVETGIPASVTAAQAILESGWMNSTLTKEHENYFGIKASSGGYNWEGSTWDADAEDAIAIMPTKEEYEVGVITEVEDGFRTYDSTWESIQDHSAYLLNSGLYDGITKAKTPEEAIDIIMDGGYATSSEYKEMLLEIIDTYDLTRFDVK